MKRNANRTTKTTKSNARKPYAASKIRDYGKVEDAVRFMSKMCLRDGMGGRNYDCY